jgi:hypothetical protein
MTCTTTTCKQDFAVLTTLITLITLVMSCRPGASAADDASLNTKCGTAEAATRCQSVRWPRLAVAFGSPEAASLSYAFVVDGKAFDVHREACRGGYGESSAVHCDIGFEGLPAQHSEGRLDVGAPDGGPVLLSIDISLQAFNYCGNGMAQIVVSASDGGAPIASAITYLDACAL